MLVRFPQRVWCLGEATNLAQTPQNDGSIIVVNFIMNYYKMNKAQNREDLVYRDRLPRRKVSHL